MPEQLAPVAMADPRMHQPRESTGKTACLGKAAAAVVVVVVVALGVADPACWPRAKR